MVLTEYDLNRTTPLTASSSCDDTTSTGTADYNVYRSYMYSVSNTDFNYYADISNYIVSLLMYKGWITEQAWLRFLYIERLKSVVIKSRGHQMFMINRKTVKGLSPIQRHHRYGRK